MRLWQLLPHQCLEFFKERLLVLEVSVNRGKPHISDLINLPQAVHQKFSYFNSRNFPIRRVGNSCLHPVHQFRQLSHAHRPFFAGLEKAVQYLLPVELLPPAVFLDHHVGNFVDPLVGGKAALAGETLSAAANGIAFAAFPGIYDFILQVTAKRTVHSSASRAIDRNFAQSRPSRTARSMPKGTITTNIINQSSSARLVAISSGT